MRCSSARAQPLVARIEVEGHPTRSGTLWRTDVVVAAEQAFAQVEEAKVVLGDGRSFAAHLAGRDPGTNVVALKLDGTADRGRLRRPSPILARSRSPLVPTAPASPCGSASSTRSVRPGIAAPAAASISGSFSTWR